MAIMRRKRLPDGTFGELEKVFSGETESETIVRLEEENKVLTTNNFDLMMASTEMYEEQYQKNLDLMMAITELYEMNMPV